MKKLIITLALVLFAKSAIAQEENIAESIERLHLREWQDHSGSYHRHQSSLPASAVGRYQARSLPGPDALHRSALIQEITRCKLFCWKK